MICPGKFPPQGIKQTVRAGGSCVIQAKYTYLAADGLSVEIGACK